MRKLKQTLVVQMMLHAENTGHSPMNAENVLVVNTLITT
jgi:hypothetical protein